jgi:hypothetical protein
MVIYREVNESRGPCPFGAGLGWREAQPKSEVQEWQFLARRCRGREAPCTCSKATVCVRQKASCSDFIADQIQGGLAAMVLPFLSLGISAVGTFRLVSLANRLLVIRFQWQFAGFLSDFLGSGIRKAVGGRFSRRRSSRRKRIGVGAGRFLLLWSFV